MMFKAIYIFNWLRQCYEVFDVRDNIKINSVCVCVSVVIN